MPLAMARGPLPSLSFACALAFSLAAVLVPGAGRAAPGPETAADGDGPVRSELVFRLDREAEFEVSREADGTAVVIRIDRPSAAVTVPTVAPDDPLVGSVQLQPDPDGKGVLARIHVRDRTVRIATQTLVQPFRIVVDLSLRSPSADRPAPTAATRSAFAMLVPLPVDTGPALLEPVVNAPVEGPDAADFRAARAAWRRGEAGTSEAAFMAFLKTHPDGPLGEAAAYYLAELRLRRAFHGSPADRVEVAKVYDQLGQLAPRSPNVALGLVRMGEVLLRESRLDEAARLADVVLDEYHHTPFVRPAAYLRARVALQANHLRTALAHFQEVRAGGVADAQGVGAAFGLAETLGRMGRYPEAVRVYELALRQDPAGPKADPRQLQLMGRALMEAGRYPEARGVFLTLYNLYPDRYPPGLALSRVADTFRGQGRWERAEEGYQYVIQHHPRGEGSLAARISLADLYVDRHRAIRSPVIASHIVGSRVDSANADELVSEALRLYGEVVELAPSDTLAEEAIFKLASLFEELGDDEEALARLLELVTRYPETDWLRPARELGELALADRVNSLVRAREPAAAVALYQRYREALFDRQLQSWTPLYPLALAHEALGLNRDAMGLYLALLGSGAPDSYRIRAVYRLGNLYMERGQPEEALKRYAYFVRRYPRGRLTGALYLRMGEANAALGRYREAAARYETYLARYAEGAQARRVRLTLADVYARAGDTDRARTLYRTVLKDDAGAPDLEPSTLEPSTARVALRLADLEYGAGRWAEAAARYRAAADAGLKGDDLLWARLRAGSADLALGRRGAAEKTLADVARAGGATVIPAVAHEVAGSAALR